MKKIIFSMLLVSTFFGLEGVKAEQIDNVTLGPIGVRGTVNSQIGFSTNFQTTGCASNGWWGVIDEVDANAKALLATVLTAVAAGKTVSVISGECIDGHNKIESMWLNP